MAETRDGCVMKRPLRFSEEQVAEMAQLYVLGWSTLRIGRHFGCLGGSVHTRLVSVGVPMRKPSTRFPGLTFHSNGYVIWAGSYVHRIVAAAWRGTPLRPGEVVHHRDGDKRNNHPDNLQVFESNTAHISSAHKPYWTPERVALLMEYRKAGLTAAEIAGLMGTTKAAVDNRARYLKASRPSREAAA